MPRSLLFTPLLALALLAAPRQSAGLGCNLRWDHCYGDGGVQNKNFACDSNAGSDALVGSFVAQWGMTDVAAVVCQLDLASASAAWPAWWEFVAVGACRRFDGESLSATPADPSATACRDWSDGLGFPNLFPSITAGLSGPNTSRFVCVMNVADTQHRTLQAGIEYFAFKLLITHAKTLGSGACAGCSTPMCITFNEVVLQTRSRATSRYLVGPAEVDSDHTTWQGGAGVGTALGTGCPAATASLRSTWGSVKSLYR